MVGRAACRRRDRRRLGRRAGNRPGDRLAIVLSILARLRRSYSPTNAVRADTGHDWRTVPAEPVPEPEPGLYVYRWGGSLYLASSARFEEQITDLAAADVTWLCADAVARSETSTTRAARR
jgi:MFS superfamily sulfate permease-like transporter